MPSRCCVTGCKSNYDSSLKNSQNNRGVSVFKFPKNEERKQAWLKIIPRKNFIPSASSVVCQLHFSSDDIILYDKHLQPDGSCKQLLLKNPRLKDGAVPSVFPNLASYLSKPAIKERTDPEFRRETISKRQNDEVENFMKADIINNFNDLIATFSIELNLIGWEHKIVEFGIYFFTLNFNDSLNIETTIYINECLEVKVFIKGEELTPQDLKWILPYDLKIYRWSQLINLLARYKDSSDSYIPPVLSILKRSLTLLTTTREQAKEQHFEQIKQLEIIVDQVRQIVNKKPKYAASTVVMAFILYSQSPTCYELIRQFFILPHKRYLQSISSSLQISPNSDFGNKNYLLNVSKSLTALERVVLLLVDEIYITARLDYRSKSIIGCASNKTSNELAKTVLTYMISSAFGNTKEVVKLLPVQNIKGTEVAEITNKIIHFVQECGFEVLCVITDNHSINRHMFKSLSQSFEFPNPKNVENKIFLAYDTVHIFKNIWKNWLNLKNLEQTFVFYDWDDLETLKYAKFKNIRDIYYEEQNSLIKQAFKLCYKSVYPTVFERQKVILADNIFHQSTISCLKSKGMNDTAQFTEIIRKWWDIVNNSSVMKGQIKRNEWCTPFEKPLESNLGNDVKLEFLKKFVVWLDKWHSLNNMNGKLTNETYHALRQSTLVLISVIDYCFKTYIDLQYILAGKFSTDNLEKRFGLYRSLSGCNYNVP
jgi:hypothetical protein